MNYWFVRSPFKTRRWEDILMAGVFNLYGIRGNAARKNISKMQKNDLALWYSSSAGKKVYGIMKVKNTAFTDKTSGSNWLAIDFIPVVTFPNPVSLKKNDFLLNSNIIKHPRISVVKILEKEYYEIKKIGIQEETASAVLATAGKADN